MNDSETRVQERLELLEQGEPLAVCLQGLDAEEAALLQTAVHLQQAPVPLPDNKTLATQRAMVVAVGLGPAAPPVVPLWKVRWEAHFQARLLTLWEHLFMHREIAFAFSFLFLLIFFFAWFGFRGNNSDAPATAVLPVVEAPAVAQLNSDIAAEISALPQQPETSSSATETEAAGALPDSNVPLAAPVAVPGSQLYLPVLSVSLQTLPTEATLHHLSGIVEVKAADGGWTAVTTNTSLPAGTHIRTGSFSRATLTFYDGSQAELGPQAELSLDEVRALRPSDGLRTVVMTQWAGSSVHQVQIRHDGGSRYEVKTPTGSGLARGTQFKVTMQMDGTAVYAVSEGKVDVNNQGRTVSVVAGQMTQFTPTDPPEPPSFLVSGVGLLTQMGSTWIIAGQAFTVNDETVILSDPQLGDWVSVEGHLLPGSDPVADTIQRLHHDHENEFTLTGPVETISDTAWVVAGQTISITAETAVEDGISVGDGVRVSGLILPADGSLVAISIELLAEPDELPFEFVGVVQTQSPTAWTISGITIHVDEETEIEEDIDVGDTVRVVGIILPDNIWLATEISLVSPEDATFTITGDVWSIDPWNVAGIPFTTADWTQIEPGIEVGDTVRVSGIILPDGTWVAAEIDLLQENVLQIIFVGTVNNSDPWVVNGLPLVTDDETIIEEGIAVGDLVRVTAWIRTDGTWLATEIIRLEDEPGPGCVAVTAVITGINGDEVILANGQTILLHEGILIEGELTIGSVVLIVACVQEDGDIEIISITVIYTPPAPLPTPTPPPAPTPPGPGNGGNVTICHRPGTPAQQTKVVPQSALGGHLGHGDTMGPCP